MARLRAGQGLPVQPPKRHFVFSGPSGTGKTTVARILGRVFYALGLLGGDHLVEAERADLVGEFLGQTAVKANELIDSALGGVLFVDEAYSLSNSGYSKGDAYGDEALQVLLKRAEDNRDRLVVILAGYPEGMDRLLAANPGLGSRFTTRVDFPSYRPLELTRIGEVLAAENGDGGTRRRWRSCAASAGTWSTQGWIDELGNGRLPAHPVREELRLPRPAAVGVDRHSEPGGPGDAAAAGPDAGVRRGAVGSRSRATAGARLPARCAAGSAGPGRRRAAARALDRRRRRPVRACGGTGRGPRRPAVSSTSSSATRPSTRPSASATAARWEAARRIAVRASSSGSSAPQGVIGRHSRCGTAPVAWSLPASRTSLTCR